jgi:hypothetical protein
MTTALEDCGLVLADLHEHAARQALTTNAVELECLISLSMTAGAQ